MAILTVSKAMASGARAIGEAVAAATGYEYLDRARMLEEVKRQGPECEKWIKGFEEYYPDVWERYDWSFRGFVAIVQSIMLNHAARDRVIISGMGAGFLLRNTRHALHVFIKASMEARMKRVQGDDEVISRDTARWLLEKSDDETARAEYAIYGRHWGDPDEYDMVLDTSLKPQGQIVDEIKEALTRCDAYNTEAARNALGLRALSAKIKAVIAINPDYDVTTLIVEPKEEGLPEYGLEIKGVVREEEDIEQIKEVARNLAGDMPVEFDLVYRWYPRIGPWQFK
jgi:shikimate kinase